jgi:hypothetical protein
VTCGTIEERRQAHRVKYENLKEREYLKRPKRRWNNNTETGLENRMGQREPD